MFIFIEEEAHGSTITIRTLTIARAVIFIDRIDEEV
jgi:hypothetical protein